MAFNQIDQQALLSSLSPLTRNMWREARKRRPFQICSRNHGLVAVMFDKARAAAFARLMSSSSDHIHVQQ